MDNQYDGHSRGGRRPEAFVCFFVLKGKPERDLEEILGEPGTLPEQTGE